MDPASKSAALEGFERQIIDDLIKKKPVSLDEKRNNLFELYEMIGINVQAELREVVAKTFSHFISNPILQGVLLPDIKYRIIGGNACNLLTQGDIPSPDIDVEVAPIMHSGSPLPFFSAAGPVLDIYMNYADHLFGFLREAIMSSPLFEGCLTNEDVTPLTTEDIEADLELRNPYLVKTLQPGDPMSNKLFLALIINRTFVSKIQAIVKYKGVVYHIVEIMFHKGPKLKAEFVPEAADFSSTTTLRRLSSGNSVYCATADLLVLQQMEALIGKKGRIVKKMEADFQYTLNPTEQIIRTLLEPAVKELDTKVVVTFIRIYQVGSLVSSESIKGVVKIICERILQAIKYNADKNPRKTFFRWMLPGLTAMSRGETEEIKALSEAVGGPLLVEELAADKTVNNAAKREQEEQNAALARQLAEEDVPPVRPAPVQEKPLKILTKKEKEELRQQQEWEEAERLTAAAAAAAAAAPTPAATLTPKSVEALPVPVPAPPAEKKKKAKAAAPPKENLNALLAELGPVAPAPTTISFPTLVYPPLKDPFDQPTIKGRREAEKALVIPPMIVLVEPYAFKPPLIEDFEPPFKRDPSSSNTSLRSRHTLETIIDFLDTRTTDPNYIFIYTMPSFQSRYQLTKAGMEGNPRYMKEDDEIYFISLIIDKLRYVIFNTELMKTLRNPVKMEEVNRMKRLFKSFLGILLRQLEVYSLLTGEQFAEVTAAATAAAPFLSQSKSSGDLQADSDLFITFYRNILLRIMEFLTFNLLEKNELLFEPEAQYFNAIRKDSVLKHMEKEAVKGAKLEEIAKEATKLEEAARKKAAAVYKKGEAATAADKKEAEEALLQFKKKGDEIQKMAEMNKEQHAVLVELWMSFYSVRIRVLKKRLNTLLATFPEERRPQNVYLYFTRYSTNSSYATKAAACVDYRNQFLVKCNKMKVQLNFLFDINVSRFERIQADLLPEDFEEFNAMFEGSSHGGTGDTPNLFAINYNICQIQDFFTQYFRRKDYFADPLFKRILSHIILSTVKGARFHPEESNYRLMAGFECIINDYVAGESNILERICMFVDTYYLAASMSATTEEARERSLEGETGILVQLDRAILELIRRRENHLNAINNIYADMLALTDKLIWDPLIPYSLNRESVLATNPYYGILTINTHGELESDYIVDLEKIMSVPEEVVPAGGGRHKKTRRRPHRKSRRGRRTGLKSRRRI